MPSATCNDAATADFHTTATAADDDHTALDDIQVRQDNGCDYDQVGVAAVVPSDVGGGHGSDWA